jgi:hypothetical protein
LRAAETRLIGSLEPLLNASGNTRPRKIPERYLKVEQDLTDAPGDRLGLRLKGDQ